MEVNDDNVQWMFKHLLFFKNHRRALEEPYMMLQAEDLVRCVFRDNDEIEHPVYGKVGRADAVMMRARVAFSEDYPTSLAIRKLYESMGLEIGQGTPADKIMSFDLVRSRDPYAED